MLNGFHEAFLDSLDGLASSTKMSSHATQAQVSIALGGLISQLAAMSRKLKRKRSDKQGNTDASEQANVAKYLRPDVTARHAANANTEVTVVKTSLNSFCKGKGKALPWEDVLLNLNKAVLEAYVLVNIHVLRMCKAQITLQPLDQRFFYRRTSAVSVSHSGVRITMNGELHTSNARAAHTSVPADNKMQAGSCNAVHLDFYRRFLKFLKIQYDLDGKQAYLMLNDIVESKYEGEGPHVLEWRRHIPRKHNSKVDNQPRLLLPLVYTFLAYIEEYNRLNQRTPGFVKVRTFSLLPFKKGFVSSHFKMCKTGLRALLQRAGQKVPGAGLPVGETLTDGKSVSVVLRKSKRKSTPCNINPADYDVVWGLNPGRRDLFVATNQLGDKVSCSRREYYEYAHINESNQIIRHWQHSQKDVLEAIRNMLTKKTTSLERLKEYVNFMIP
uniref:Uncharacterized protein n=1 Tax=Globisporangium ultimum (strain ATCC 200006 / CBS 805.95 / DAOM BR144) TaxID=431595 RepID=K3WX02_GLOUD